MIGSPLYAVSPEHVAGVLALLGVPIVWWLLRRTHPERLAPVQWLLVGLLLASAAIHGGLVLSEGGPSHGPAIGILFAADAMFLIAVAVRVLRGASAGRLGVAVLVGSIIAYWIAMASEPPDQLGLATKLGEILALAIIARPAPGTRVRRLGAAARGLAICLLVVGTAASTWIGAFRAAAADPSAVAGHRIHGGSVPPPGTLLPILGSRDATPEERAAANDIVLRTRAAIARYADPAVAGADGYQVTGLAGIDFHAANSRYEKDRRVFDPARPESLVYAVAPDGRPVVLGAVFQMPEIGQPGPAVGGPLTVWHRHQDICVSLTPPALAGLLSPLGTCPVGSILLPRTAEMIHVWTVPGAPEPFGDLADSWRRAYLRAVAARP